MLSQEFTGKSSTQEKSNTEDGVDSSTPNQAEESIRSILESHGDNVNTYGETLDSISRTAGMGSQSGRYQDVYFGMNRLPVATEIPIHKETQGLILLTRPDLNLSYNNISKVRQLSHLLTQDTNTAMSAVRLALDPTTQRGAPVFIKSFREAKSPMVPSKLTDAFNPYLSLLSNTCITMSPPPDLGINLYTSPEGMFREQWIMNDSVAENHSYYDISCTFNNIKGNSVMMMILTWILYMGYLRVGPLGPHGHNRVTNRMDYFTRIERYKFDDTGRYIEQWFHTGGSVPKSVSIGNSFGFNKLEPYEFENKDVSVQFGSVGAYYNDPIQLWEFNLRMFHWNPVLASESKRKQYFYKAPKLDDALTNWTGYPLINLATREMEWWIPKGEYKRIIAGLYDTVAYTAHLEEYTNDSKSMYAPVPED